eukprot:2414875-Rhodomonas_salina.4
MSDEDLEHIGWSHNYSYEQRLHTLTRAAHAIRKDRYRQSGSDACLRLCRSGSSLGSATRSLRTPAAIPPPSHPAPNPKLHLTAFLGAKKPFTVNPEPQSPGLNPFILNATEP